MQTQAIAEDRVVQGTAANSFASRFSGPLSSGRRRAWACLLVRKECWRLSLRGKLLLLMALTSLLFIAHWYVYPWLAVTDRQPAEYLVVDGWVHASGLKAVIAEFKRGGYRQILTSGCMGTEEGSPNPRANYADWTADDLRQLGVPKEVITPIPSWGEAKDRTFNSALAVKKWFQDTHTPVKCVNVVALGPHARRSRLLFQKAFGGQVAVGVVAVPNGEYDSKHWWRTSEGVREVIGEGIAYIYAKFFFWPSSENQGS
jgi:uncharacterized SAM-binding protein YcdF (DUF218 family)